MVTSLCTRYAFVNPSVFSAVSRPIVQRLFRIVQRFDRDLGADCSSIPSVFCAPGPVVERYPGLETRIIEQSAMHAYYAFLGMKIGIYLRKGLSPGHFPFADNKNPHKTVLIPVAEARFPSSPRIVHHFALSGYPRKLPPVVAWWRGWGLVAGLSAPRTASAAASAAESSSSPVVQPDDRPSIENVRQHQQGKRKTPRRIV